MTWFLVQALLDAAAPLGPRLEAITGFIAIVVLLVVMNWFVHKVYWSQWIGRHHRQRRKVLERGNAVVLGLVALGFTSVYREGFEVVLFLQNLQLQAGTATVLEGVGIGLAATAVVGVLTFWLHHKLPYRKMLVLTGVLLGGRAGRDDGRHRAHVPGPRLAAVDAAAVRDAGLARLVVRDLRDLRDDRLPDRRRDARGGLLRARRADEGAPPGEAGRAGARGAPEAPPVSVG